jgi:hypothetical protein
MPSLWFVTPAHGRAKLAAICLRQLRRTCDALTANGTEASAVVIADDENLHTARTLGFATVRRNNEYLGRKFNDGIQLACDPEFNPRPADYVVPCGSDDWIDHRILHRLPGRNTVVGFQRMSFVREDGLEIAEAFVNYTGGCGMRIYPRQVMAAAGYRPADEDRKRGCDTSILVNLRQTVLELNVVHARTDPRQIVDWKTSGEQINSYGNVAMWLRGRTPDPFEVLADVYPSEALEEMAALYGRRKALVAA